MRGDPIYIAAVIRAQSPSLPSRPARFCSGSILRHTCVMAGTGSVGLLAVFSVDLLNLLYISMLHDRALTAAIGFIGAVSYLQMAVSIGLAIGLGAAVSRRIGAGDFGEARQIASAALTVMVGVMLVIGLGTVLLLDPLLHALGARGAVLAAATRNLRIISPFLPLITLGMGCSALLRSVGDARRSMTVTLWSALLLACLDPVLIFGLHLGLEGAAISTVLSRATAAGLGLLAVRHHDFLERPYWRKVPVHAWPVLNIGFPAALTNLATPVGSAYTTHVMAKFGLGAVSGQATIDRIIPVAFAFIFALTGSVGPIMAQNLGARQFPRVRETLSCALLLVLSCVLAMWAALDVLQDQVVALFSATGDMAMLLHLFCTWTVASFLFIGALFVANAAFNNLGHPLLSTLFNWGRATLGTIPFVLLGMRYGPRGVLVGQAAGGIVFGLLAVITAFALTRRLHPAAARRQPTSPLPALSVKATMAEMAELTREEANSKA